VSTYDRYASRVHSARDRSSTSQSPGYACDNRALASRKSLSKVRHADMTGVSGRREVTADLIDYGALAV
jgi:hypothetical protein